jgi:hypothetical protein
MIPALKNLTTLFISLLLIFFITEIGLRLFYPQIVVCPVNSDWQKSDTELPYLIKSNYKGKMFRYAQYDITFNTNSQGFRNLKDISLRKPEGVKRIIFIGDSFTFGWGVGDPETFAYLFEQGLNSKRRQVEVVNAAVYGFDIDEYRILFDRMLKFNPDIIYIGFCLENDFNYTVRCGATIKEELRAERKNMAFYIREYINSLHIVSLIRDRLYILFPSVRSIMLKSGVNNKRDIFLKEYPVSLKLLLKETQNSLAEMNNICKARNIKFVVILIPLREQVYCRSALNAFKDYDAERPNQAIIDILKANKIHYIDLLPQFLNVSGASAERLYFDSDPHLTKAGHMLTAEILLKDFNAINN